MAEASMDEQIETAITRAAQKVQELEEAWHRLQESMTRLRAALWVFYETVHPDDAAPCSGCGRIVPEGVPAIRRVNYTMCGPCLYPEDWRSSAETA
jgi:hypothetical protein